MLFTFSTGDRQVARKIHARKETSVFLKLDISRAFDLLNWSFLFEVMRKKGFGLKWCTWILILLRTANTRVIVNGVPGRSFIHAKGLRQGDPVSPLLFVIAMDVLSRIMIKAESLGVVSSFTGITAHQSVSIYADDVALFVKPRAPDLAFVRAMLHAFGVASGLRVNYQKSLAIMIHDDNSDRERVESILNCQLGNFPCKYLGLQLAIRQLTRAEWQPMIDHAKKCAPAWQRGLLHRPGRLVLVKSVIAAKPIHHFMVLEAPNWVFEEIEKWMRSFFWAGKDKVNGGQCLVAWSAVCKPTWLGGLGLRNLQMQGLALRVMWEWLRRTDPDRPWQGLPMIVDKEAREVFDSLVEVAKSCSGEIDGSTALRLKTLHQASMLWWILERSIAAQWRRDWRTQDGCLTSLAM